MADLDAMTQVCQLIQRTRERLAKNLNDLAVCEQNIALLDESKHSLNKYVTEDRAELKKLNRLKTQLSTAQAAAAKAAITGGQA